MITMELLGKIRRMHVREKLSKRAIAKRTGLSRNTVHKWLKTPQAVQTPKSAVVKVVVAFLLVIQAAFSVVVASFLGAVVGLRCTSSIGSQLRVEPDQRFGLALRAAA